MGFEIRREIMFSRAFAGASAAAIVTVLALTSAPSAAEAQNAGVFAGKTVQMLIGFGPGGGYDLWGRVVARHIGPHLPGNPTVVAQNMPGAGSYVAANHIYSEAPKDGTVMGIIARDAALGPLTGAEGARFDSTKMSWLGTPALDTNICIANSSAKVKKVDDLYTQQLIVGDTGTGTGTHSYPLALSALLGMKFKLIPGFPSSADVFLAMERGEVDGICESLDSVTGRRPDWISGGKVNVLFQGGAKPNPDLKGVPFILDLVKNPDDKIAISFLYAGQGIGRPFITPPGLPPGRLQMLRDAFDATMKDPDFLADAKKVGLAVDPESGAELAALIDRIYATPKPIVEKIGKLIQ
jgi:tripartite-type tricarboxylate transporter receptor subunit TctC